MAAAAAAVDFMNFGRRAPDCFNVAIGFCLLQRRGVNSATILAMSLDDYRKTELANKYPRASWIVAIVAATIAVVAIVAAALTPQVQQWLMGGQP